MCQWVFESGPTFEGRHGEECFFLTRASIARNKVIPHPMRHLGSDVLFVSLSLVLIESNDVVEGVNDRTEIRTQ